MRRTHILLGTLCLLVTAGITLLVVLLVQTPQSDAERPAAMNDTSTPTNAQQASEGVCERRSNDPPQVQEYLHDLCVGGVPADLDQDGLVAAGHAYCEGVALGGTREEGLQAGVDSGVLDYSQAFTLANAAQDAFCPDVIYQEN